MSLRIAYSLLIFTLVCSTRLASAAAPQSLTVATFNVEYYGLGGSSNGSPADEKRDPILRQFFARELPPLDVLIIEEIVDLARFQKNLVPGWSCLTYPHPNPKHQHVAMCARSGLRFVHEPSDDNDIIDAVAVEERSRPALHLLLAGDDGVPFLRLIGVHLKAFPDFATVRDQQARTIADYLSHVANPLLPVLITGDTNSYPRGANGRDIDDAVMMSRAFAATPTAMAEVPNAFPQTYRSPEHAGTFDRFWLSRTLRPAGPLWTYPLCSGQPVKMFRDVASYNHGVSDHCPVVLRLQLR